MNHARIGVWLGTALLTLLGCHPAISVEVSPAVEVDPGGSGQVLILPIWTTTGDHATLLNLQSPHETGYARRIAKLRLLDGEGNTVFSGNLYFQNEHDSWAAGIGAREGGGSRLVSNNETCLLVSGEQKIEPFSGVVDIDADFGSLEVIVMGTDWRVEGDDVWPRASAAVKCEQLAEKWNDGDWKDTPETGVRMHAQYQLRAEWLIVNADRGTLYQVPGVAIDGYSDLVQHTPPDDPLPDLASGHGTNTDEGVNRSRVCSDGLCREDAWPTPLDAMAAALMVDHFRGSFNINPGAGASTDLVVTYPLVKYYAARNGVEHPLGHSAIQMDTRDRAGNDRTAVTCVPTVGIPCFDTYWTAPLVYAEDPPWPLELKAIPQLFVTFNPADELIAPSALLELPDAYRIDIPPVAGPDDTVIALPPLPNEGSFLARPNELPLNVGYTMEAADGFRYRGSPAIPVVFQQYVNGVLLSSDGTPQRANYGASFVPSHWAWPIGWDDLAD